MRGTRPKSAPQPVKVSRYLRFCIFRPHNALLTESTTPTANSKEDSHDGFEKGMKAAGKSLELFRYDAEHGFGNEQRLSVHDRQCAELAWGRATEFFRKHLG